jgi:glycosyltransferase involved in cell wall biosynthesis
MSKSNISIVIPVHELTEETEKLFDKAIESVRRQQVKPDVVCIVVPKDSDADKYMSKYKFNLGEIIVMVVPNDGKTDFCSQVNLGIEKVPTEWFSILEYDDEYSNTWFKNVITYMKAYPEVGIFMPMIVDVTLGSQGEEQYIGGTNEAVWANQFSDEMGILDTDALLRYQNFNTDGIVMKKSAIDDFGGFKSSIKLTFIYEFLLRMTHSGIKTMVIPKIGYKHLNLRPDSLFHQYRKDMGDTESRWWMQKAKKEYFWSEDRKLTYENNATG